MKQILGNSVAPSPIHTQVTLSITLFWPQESCWVLCAKQLSTWSLVLSRPSFTPSPDKITLLNLIDLTQLGAWAVTPAAHSELLLLLETLPRIASWPQLLSSKGLEIKDLVLKSETKVWREVIPSQGRGKDLFDNAVFGLEIVICLLAHYSPVCWSALSFPLFTWILETPD